MTKEDTIKKSQSQIEPTVGVREMFVQWSLPNINTPADLMALRERLLSHLVIRPYDDTTKEEEKKFDGVELGLKFLKTGMFMKEKHVQI